MKLKCWLCGGKAKTKYRLDGDYFCKACWHEQPMSFQCQDREMSELEYLAAEPGYKATLSGPEVPNHPIPLEDHNVFEQAESIVYGRAEREYGHPRDNYRRIADLWSPILGRTVTPGEVVLCMAQVKVARLIATPMHRDSVVDLAGYAGVYERVKWE